jgi:hypothetical protein
MQQKTKRSIILKSLFWAAIWMQLTASAVKAEEFCAVTLNVFGPHGEPNNSTWIELDDPSGKAVQKRMMAGPTLYLCDFSFGPHTLRVGTNECFPVAISNLRVVVGSPITLNVTLNACGYREQVRSGCLLYVRVVDDEGIPLSEVDFSPRIASIKPPKTDSYGRYQTIFSGKQEMTFTKPGLSPEMVSVQCETTEEIDRVVVMKKAND